ncbi:MAG: NAD(P)H-hydrate epimerase, partial [Phycisphaeraceae bacterium]|nr:NAD(P)H-hydrate epimerase [Phycisphaeraceae bacterium]
MTKVDPRDEPILTREQVREVDRLAIEEIGIPGIVLMENAARNGADVASEMLAETGGRTVAIFCGGGNNGGDGYAIGRHLHNRGMDVTIVAAKDREGLDGDAATNAAIIDQLDVVIVDVLDEDAVEGEKKVWADADLLIDALLGTGFEGEVRGHLVKVIEAINYHSAPTLAVDVPSGLDAGSGEPSSATVRAARTVTFVATKEGLVTEAA